MLQQFQKPIKIIRIERRRGVFVCTYTYMLNNFKNVPINEGSKACFTSNIYLTSGKIKCSICSKDIIYLQ